MYGSVFGLLFTPLLPYFLRSHHTGDSVKALSLELSSVLGSVVRSSPESGARLTSVLLVPF